MTSWRSRAGASFGGVAATALAWGWIEAGWLRFMRFEVPIPALEPKLAGLRIAHLSDFHLGLRSRGTAAVMSAVNWAALRDPDLVLVTGDLLSRPRGEKLLRGLLDQLGDRCYVVLGNHDVEHSRDPFSRTVGLRDLAPATLLVDESVTVDFHGRRVQLVGVDPRSYRQRRARPWELVDADADLRILLCHYPYILDTLPPGAFQLVLAGHMHDGQISLPLPGGKLRLANPRARYSSGLYERAGTWMHVSPGLGTTFVPFRFFARPEATELVLQPA
jgi:predicted MPP superfamily phosphohydrolase